MACRARQLVLAAVVLGPVLGVGGLAAGQTVVVLPGLTFSTDISSDGRVVAGVNVPPGWTDFDYFAWSAGQGFRQAGTGSFQSTGLGAPFISGDGHNLCSYAGDPAGRSLILSDTGVATYIPGPAPETTRAAVGGISADGNAAAGWSFNPTQTLRIGWRWTRADGLQTMPMNDIRCISGDGSTVVGSGFADQSIIWRNGVVSTLATVPGSSLPTTTAYRTNFDGSVIVGDSGLSAARWMNNQGILLPFVAGSSVAHATDVTEDGQLILGRTNGGVGGRDRIFIWTPARGSELITSYFASFGIDLTGYAAGSASVNATGNIFALTASPPGSTLTQTLVITIPSPGPLAGLLCAMVVTRRRRP